MTGKPKRDFRRQNEKDGDIELTDVSSDDISPDYNINISEHKNTLLQSDPSDENMVDEMDAIDHTMDDFDRDVLSIYLNRPLEDIRAENIIREEAKDGIDSSLRSYPFWNAMGVKDREQLRSLYLDYYMVNVLSRAYNEANMLLRESDDIDTARLSEFNKKRIELLERKDFLDDAIVYKLNQEVNQYQNRTSDMSDIDMAIKDMMEDLEMNNNELDTNEIHEDMIMMIHDDTSVRRDL